MSNKESGKMNARIWFETQSFHGLVHTLDVDGMAGDYLMEQLRLAGCMRTVDCCKALLAFAESVPRSCRQWFEVQP